MKKMRVLLVKLTSMGDLIHALPALTEASQAIPGISFDWVIEKSFSEVALWHPAVYRIIPTSHRLWRKNFWGTVKNKEILNFIKTLREENYDVVIDGQSSLKSAVVTRLSKGIRHGLDKYSSREKIASLFYQQRHYVNFELQAITRLRLLFAAVLGYTSSESPPDYGIAQYPFPALPLMLPKPYLVFVHMASWKSKLWPEPYWRELIALAEGDGFHVVLPWGNEEERQRAERLGTGFTKTQVLPGLNLSEQARVLKEAKGAICSDTGLSHLAAALSVPAVTMYGPTRRDRIGTVGTNQQQVVSPFHCIACHRQECHYGDRLQDNSLCLLKITPHLLWQTFKKTVTL